MRLRVVTVPVLLLVALSAVWAHRPEVRRVPRAANITAACTPGGNPGVHPPSIAMARADHIAWTSVSPRAVSWTITPKDPANWPFAEPSFTGTPGSPAVTPQPLPGALLNHVYGYNVTVVCSDGTSQVIDPDIIIGE
jgi:hypothetical protein